MLTNEQIQSEVRALKSRGVVARDLAKSAGITPEYLSKLVNGKVKRPSGVVLDALEKAIAAAKVRESPRTAAA